MVDHSDWDVDHGDRVFSVSGGGVMFPAEVQALMGWWCRSARCQSQKRSSGSICCSTPRIGFKMKSTEGGMLRTVMGFRNVHWG